MTFLLVAAGGGGDALGAAILARSLGLAIEETVIATFAWERLRVDPLPGPRGTGSFHGLTWRTPDCALVTARTSPVSPSGSTLPRLSGDLGRPLVLLDPHGGEISLRKQLVEAVDAFQVDEVIVVDVGGDALARGNEAGLRSPLADALVLSACAAIDRPVHVSVLGPGLDGELSEPEVMANSRAAEWRVIERRHVGEFTSILRWHPSEATGMLAAAARGARGTVEVRGEGLHAELTELSAGYLWLPLEDVIALSGCARAMSGTSSLSAAEEAVIAVTGRSEIEFERVKARRLSDTGVRQGTRKGFADRLRGFSEAAAERGSDYVTSRRIAEALGLSASDEELRGRLAEIDPDRYVAPLWRTR
ncbi:DUF1152 domain-containing protein [Nocardiopsis sp. NRRL B-16309]|uniref:DUF1152 domain-containing protein n=1 Tax=Nocardiopsis sp. NRRL B-16309 TaxID=1519494 RepID=UPI0006C6A132|nr:DUF1152 domain-containing protein [Nocardiopsis sp. NRRL B-16309]KOX18051.1 hypothetical protein ADL05_08020 [Nocardiopsis sp. NRRL B-16309]